MQLSLLTQYFPPEVGAPQARLGELAVHFARRGHGVTVLTAMPNYPTGKIYPGYGGLLQREQWQGVEVVRSLIFPTQKASFIHRVTNYLSFVASSSVVGSFLLHRSDYLMVESPPLFLGLAGLWLSKLKRARLIFNVSDLWPESAVRLGVLAAGGPSFRLSAWLERFCYDHAWLVTGQSKTILEDINERFPGRPTFHLSNGVDTQIFSPDRATDRGRALLNGKGNLVVLYAGLFGLAQGLDQVLDAADRLRDEGGLDFVFVGDGPQRNRLTEQARRQHLANVHFLDGRPAGDMPALVASADIVIVPLKVYIPGAVPSKLYEAMASGRPVVLVAEGEAADIVRRCHAGLVVKPGDIEALGQAIRTLAREPALRRTLGENGRRAAEQYFDRTMIATDFIKYLEDRL